MIRRFSLSLIISMWAVASSAGAINLLGDSDFLAFPEVCEFGTDNGCWSVSAFETWFSVVDDGNDQKAGSGAPAAQCNTQMGAAQCLIMQCIDLSGIPAGTSFTYGFATKLLLSPESAVIAASAYSSNSCMSGTFIGTRNIEFAATGLDVWQPNVGTFQSEKGDGSVTIFYVAFFPEDTPMSKDRTPSLRIDDGFLFQDTDVFEDGFESGDTSQWSATVP